ncbi:MAG: methylglyoxal synthase [Chloroflexi bacterium]|nr:methylglyoxal synthase [Chloroflexota bacterium]
MYQVHPEASIGRKIALVAHDSQKLELLAWARFNRDLLARYELFATGTTGRLLQAELDLSVECFQSGPLGGDQQIGARIAEGLIDCLVFFWDPLASQPHDPDVKALLRIAVVWNIPVACNRASADYMVSSPLMQAEYESVRPDYAAHTRGSGVLVVYTFIILAIGVPVYTVAPSLVSQAASFGDTLPERLQNLLPYASGLQPRPLQALAVGALDQAIQAVRSPQNPAQDQIVQAGATAAHTLLSFFTVFVLAYYWLVERASIKRAILRTVPVRRARDVNTVWMEVEEKLGGWVRGQLTLMLAVGVMATIGYAVLGLPNPILLGVAAGLFEIIPMVGPFLAFAPAVLIALAAVDPTRALAVAGYALVIQQIESNILVPRVMGRTVGVSALTVLIGILVGAALAGLPGAFLAVPLAGALQVILAHVLRIEDPSQAEEHADPVDRANHQGTPPPRNVVAA